MAIDDRPIAFYRSTGTGSPDKVKKSTWVPFNGISRRGGGWFIKVPGKVPTGDLRTASSWLRSRARFPTKVFDEIDYADTATHSAAVNDYLNNRGALYTAGGGPFAIGTVNVGRR